MSFSSNSTGPLAVTCQCHVQPQHGNRQYFCVSSCRNFPFWEFVQKGNSCAFRNIFTPVEHTTTCVSTITRYSLLITPHALTWHCKCSLGSQVRTGNGSRPFNQPKKLYPLSQPLHAPAVNDCEICGRFLHATYRSVRITTHPPRGRFARSNLRATTCVSERAPMDARERDYVGR